MKTDIKCMNTPINLTMHQPPILTRAARWTLGAQPFHRARIPPSFRMERNSLIQPCTLKVKLRSYPSEAFTKIYGIRNYQY